MLLMFKVKNYKSFKNEAVLDMRASIYVQLPTHVICCENKTKILKSAVIYGANSAGKTNFINALVYFKEFIISQFENNPPVSAEQINKLEPFNLSDDHDLNSEFEMLFEYRNKEFRYGFESNANEIINEWMDINKDNVFKRTKNSVVFGSKYDALLSPFKKSPKERLYVAEMDDFLDAGTNSTILVDFKAFFKDAYHIFDIQRIKEQLSNANNSNEILPSLLFDKVLQGRIERYLRYINSGIKRFDITFEVIINEETNKRRKVKTVKSVHDVYKDGQIIGEKCFDLKQESHGTLEFLAYLQTILAIIKHGGILIIDVLSANFHPLLTKLILDIFSDQKNQSAQIIFVSNDISILNANQFRRDEILFVDKNIYGESSMYKLSSFNIREDSTFSKFYLRGDFRAIPIFKKDELKESD